MDADEVDHKSKSIKATTIENYLRGHHRKRDIAKDVAAKWSLQLAKELTSKRKDGVLPKAVSDLIQKIDDAGESTIERMVVVRTPVQAYVGQLMQIVSIGKYRDVISESYYDKMFHLAILINGRYILQKNEVIALTDSGDSLKNQLGKGSDTMAVKIPKDITPQLTFATLLESTKQHMGPKLFSNYCAKANNCQDFILAVLQSNGLAYPHLISFVKQNSEEIFNKLPIHTPQVARALTNVAAVGDKLVEDIVVKHQETDYKELMQNIAEVGKVLLSTSITSSKSKDTKTIK